MKEEYSYLSVLISVLYRKAHLILNNKLNGLNVNASEHAYILALEKEKARNKESLACHFNIHKANVSRGIAKLKAKGFVKESVSEEDKRKSVLSLSRKGQYAVDKIKNAMDKVEKELLKNVSINEKEKLMRLLKKIL